MVVDGLLFGFGDPCLELSRGREERDQSRRSNARALPLPAEVGGATPHPPCLLAGKPWVKLETSLLAGDPPRLPLGLAGTHSSLASRVVLYRWRLGSARGWLQYE